MPAVAGRLERFVSFRGSPARVEGDPSGPTFAAGVRAYKGGARHRGFLEVSVPEHQSGSKGVYAEDGSKIKLEEAHFYGPGVQVGWRFTARSGFTFIASGGIGYALGGGDWDVDPWTPMLSLGVGGTWP